MFDPAKIEADQLKQWQAINLRSQLLKKGTKPFYFLQGPPYTSGRIHVGQAWNNSLKDMALRYKRMTDHNVFDRAGYDMHGLPTESKVMAKLNLKNKEDIEKYGHERFITECIEFCKEHAQLMSEDFKKIGIEMDFDNAYQPISKDFIDGVWWLIKTLHEKGRLYESFRTVYWDWKHETALSKHELEYKTVKDTSVFVKFPLKEDNNTSLIIWTTTPWTLPFNLAVMVNPDMEYMYCKTTWEGKDETWIVAKALAGPFMRSVMDRELHVVKTVKGEELEGLSYTPAFAQEMQEHYKKIEAEYLHKVILSSDHVDASAGTGLVHCAPGCGPEDFEVGWKYGLPAFNTLNESGVFTDGAFQGRNAILENIQFVIDLKSKNILLAKSKIEHEYPHAQRSGAPIIFRATKQWFWKVEDLKHRMIEENDKVHWVPQSGYNAFSSWLNNLRDNSITKQRLWGTPVPIWRNIDNDEDIIVIGSMQELEQLSGSTDIEPHRPWIDNIEITKDGKTYRRLTDVLDVWIDAGTAAWNALDFPKRTDLFEKLYPADFICEGTDQIRGWFNLLMVSSIAAFDKPAFKSVYMHGMITDIEGVKMSKSLGNIISPYEIVDKYGADTLRYYFIKTKAGEDISFSWDEAAQHNRNLRVLYNTVQLLIQTSKQHETETQQAVNLEELPQELDIMDKYILARVQQTIKRSTELFESYTLYAVPAVIEELFMDISRVYIQNKRDELNEEGKQREQTLQVLYYAISKTLQMFSPIAPFITDHLYSALSSVTKNHKQSVHLESYPTVDDRFVDEQMVEDITIAQGFISDILFAREQMAQNVRFPLKEAYLVANQQQNQSLLRATEFIKNAANVREVQIVQEHPALNYAIKPNMRNLGKKFGQQTPLVAKQVQILSKEDYQKLIDERKLEVIIDSQTYTINPDDVTTDISLAEGFSGTPKTVVPMISDPQLEKEGLAREFIRRIQQLRKDKGLVKSQFIAVDYSAEGMLDEAVTEHNDLIVKKCNIRTLKKVSNPQGGKNEKIKQYDCTAVIGEVY